MDGTAANLYLRNRGRKAVTAAEGMSLVENNPFITVVYDPVGKGNDLAISVENFTHTVAVKLNCIIEEKKES